MPSNDAVAHRPYRASSLRPKSYSRRLMGGIRCHADDAILWLATLTAFVGPERVLFWGHRHFRPR